MEVMWTSPASALTVRDVGEYFPDHAYTTILTVLSRLSAKGFLQEVRQGRLNTFTATASRRTTSPVSFWRLWRIRKIVRRPLPTSRSAGAW